MLSMFSGCTGLTSLDLTSFQTPRLRDTKDMFRGCTGLESLDISSLDMQTVTLTTDMFTSTSNLKEVKLGKNFDFVGTMLPNPPSPANGQYSGRWEYVDGDLVMTSAELRDSYDGATMAGTWVWELAQQYWTLILDPAGGTIDGSPDPLTLTCAHGDSIVLPNAEREGYRPVQCVGVDASTNANANSALSKPIVSPIAAASDVVNAAWDDGIPPEPQNLEKSRRRSRINVIGIFKSCAANQPINAVISH